MLPFSVARAVSYTHLLADDEDTAGVGNTFTFWVVKSATETDAISAPYTVNWTMGEASTEATVTSATLGTGDNKYTGVVDNAANTIKFTVPYGYATSGDKTVEVKVNDTASITGGYTQFKGTIETNEIKGAADTFTLTSQLGTNPETWTVTVKEADALTAISVGDVDGEFGTQPSGTNEGYEDGTITFNMPADTAKVDNELNLVPTFTIGSAFTEVTLNGEEITSGEEFDFADLLDAEMCIRDRPR